MSTDAASVVALPEVPPLDYATGRRRLGFVRRHAKAIARLAVLAAIGTVVYVEFKPIKRLVLWRYWHHQLAKLSQPAPVPVYLKDDAAIEAGRTSARLYDFIPAKDGDPPQAVYCPKPLRELLAIDPHLASQFELEEDSIRPMVRYASSRVRPDGQARVVVIRWGGGDWGNLVDGTSIHIIEPPTWFERPDRSDTIARWPSFVCGTGRIMAEPTFCDDPNDSSAVVMHSTTRDLDPTVEATLVGRLTNEDKLVWSIASYAGPERQRPYVLKEPLGKNRQAYAAYEQAELAAGRGVRVPIKD